jgi:copper transport protein
VGTLPALTATTFGKVLLVKLVGVVALLALGNLARRWVQRNLVKPSADRPDAGQTQLLRRGLAVEFGVAAAVLGLTAALVVTIPGREGFIRKFTRTLDAQSLTVKLKVDSPRTGDTVLHLSALGPTGRPMPIMGLTGSLSQKQAGLGPLPLRISSAGGVAPSGVEKVGLTFPRRGDWTLQFTVQTSALDATSFSVTIGVT